MNLKAEFGKKTGGLYASFMSMSIGKRLILGSFVIWMIQAIPKWGVVLLDDGQMAANIMTLFITPRY